MVQNNSFRKCPNTKQHTEENIPPGQTLSPVTVISNPHIQPQSCSFLERASQAVKRICSRSICRFQRACIYCRDISTKAAMPQTIDTNQHPPGPTKQDVSERRKGAPTPPEAPCVGISHPIINVRSGANNPRRFQLGHVVRSQRFFFLLADVRIRRWSSRRPCIRIATDLFSRPWRLAS